MVYLTSLKLRKNFKSIYRSLDKKKKQKFNHLGITFISFLKWNGIQLHQIYRNMTTMPAGYLIMN